ncbi:hypothetical protein B484DRAFT_405097, partial [Ochromonadaceae sp. CCMP2298]
MIKRIDVKYDLKGSLAGRLTPPDACIRGAVQKDVNLNESGRKLCLGANIDIFRTTLEADVRLLQRLNIMDYSLLVGVHERRGDQERSAAPSAGTAMAGTGAGTGAGVGVGVG